MNSLYGYFHRVQPCILPNSLLIWWVNHWTLQLKNIVIIAAIICCWCVSERRTFRALLSVYGSTALVDLGRFFSFLIYTQSVRLLWRGISSSQDRYIHTEKHTQNKRTQTFMPRVGFEPTLPMFKRAKTVNALDRTVTVMGIIGYHCV
jgi:hypothetical protein